MRAKGSTSTKGSISRRRSTGGIITQIPNIIRAGQAGAKLVKNAYHEYKRYSARKPKPQTARRPAKRSKPSPGASMSKSMGFLKTRRGTKNKFDVFLSKGVIEHRERAGLQDNLPVGDIKPQVVYIGHTTYDKDVWQLETCRAIIKLLFKKAGLQIATFQSGLMNNTANQGWYFCLEYKLGSNAPISLTTQSYTAITTPDTMAGWLQGVIFPTTESNDQRILVALTLSSAHATESTITPVAKVDLTRLRCHFHVKSSLKIQNRTISTAGNTDEEDVDNVPVYGKSYEGPGNGATYNYSSERQSGIVTAIGEQPIATNFVIKPVALGNGVGVFNNSMWKEPPYPKQFYKVSANGKVHLDPGHIKTSNLIYTKSHDFHKMKSVMYDGTTTPAGGGVRTYLGNYRFFCMEKMIQAVATTETNKINIAYEVDIKVGCFVTEHFNYRTVMISNSEFL